MQENERQPRDGLRFGCPGCGSGLRYDIQKKNMYCDSCGQTYSVAEMPDPSKNSEDGLMDAAEYSCPQCGAAVHTSQTAATSYCAFCGADVILTERLVRTRRPDEIVPFQITREKCEELYRERLKQARFAPAALTRQETLEHFRPVYVPFWNYSAEGTGTGTGTGKQVYEDRRYIYTDTYRLKADYSYTASNVLYDAAVGFEDETGLRLSFSNSKARPFHPAFLCGFYAETADTDPSLYEKVIITKAIAAVDRRMESESGMSSATFRLGEDDHRIRASLILMPVWLLAHRQGKRVVYTAVNGSSGKIICDTPVDQRLFARLALVIALVLALCFSLLSSVLPLRPRVLAALCALLSVVGQWVMGHETRGLIRRRNRENDPTWQMNLRKGEGKTPEKRLNPGAEGMSSQEKRELLRLVMPVIFGIAFVLFLRFIDSDDLRVNTIVASLVSDHGGIPTLLTGLSLLVQIILCIVYRKGGREEMWLRRLLTLTMIIAFFLMRAMSADAAYYACSMAMLAITATSMLLLSIRHNEYVSRPVPFFGKEEAP